MPPGLSGVVEIAAGNGHSMALKADGTVASWGGNSRQQTAGLAGISKIAAGTYHKLALTGSGGAPRITSSRR